MKENIYVNPDPANSKREAKKYASQTMRFLFVPRFGMCEQVAEAATNSVIDLLTIPAGARVLQFGEDFTYGSNQHPLNPEQIQYDELTTSTYAPVRTEGEDGYVAATDLYKYDLSDFIYFVQQRSTLKLQQIITEELSKTSIAQRFPHQRSKLQSLVQESPNSTNFTEFVVLMHNDFWQNFILYNRDDPDRGLLRMMIKAWTDSPEFGAAQCFLKSPRFPVDQIDQFVSDIKSNIIDAIGAALGAQTAAGSKPMNGSYRSDQFYSLITDTAAICFVINSDGQHSQNHVDMRKIAELKNLMSYLRGTLPEKINFNIDPIRNGFDLDLRLSEVRKMVFQLYTQHNPPPTIQKMTLNEQNANIICALCFHQRYKIKSIVKELHALLATKRLWRLNRSEYALFAGFLATYPEQSEAMLDHLLDKFMLENSVQRGLDLEKYDELFATIPELAVRFERFNEAQLQSNNQDSKVSPESQPFQLVRKKPDEFGVLLHETTQQLGKLAVKGQSPQRQLVPPLIVKIARTLTPVCLSPINRPKGSPFPLRMDSLLLRAVEALTQSVRRNSGEDPRLTSTAPVYLTSDVKAQPQNKKTTHENKEQKGKLMDASFSNAAKFNK